MSAESCGHAPNPSRSFLATEHLGRLKQYINLGDLSRSQGGNKISEFHSVQPDLRDL